MSGLEQINLKISAYRRRYYKRKAIAGAITFAISFLVIFFLFAYVEYQLWMSSEVRGIIFYFFLIFSVISFSILFLKPFLKFYNLSDQISNEAAAIEIAKFFPEIQDKLLNLLQLGKHNSSDNDLISAAIDKKAKELDPIPFSQAIDFSVIKKYAIGFVFAVIAFFLVSFINPAIIKDSSKRLADYSTVYERKAPFQFLLLTEELLAFKGDDYTIDFEIKGDYLPDNVSLVIDGNREVAFTEPTLGVFSFTFERIQRDAKFQIQASGYLSKEFQIKTLERPDLLSMNITISNPPYTGGSRKRISNTGDMTILEGSLVNWEIKSLATQTAQILHLSDTFKLQRQQENVFLTEQRIFAAGTYEIELANQYSTNSSELSYRIDVIKDEYPKIQAEFFPDSASFRFITMAGSISDDYGFTRLTLHYRLAAEDIYKQVPLEFNSNNTSQSFYANWDLDSLRLSPGNKLETYLSVTDNDQINGVKSSRSNYFIFQIPTNEKIENILSEKSQDVENQLDKSKNDIQNIAERLNDVEERLKTEQKFDWQEEKIVKDIIQDREKLNKEIEELMKKNQDLQKTTNQFNKQSQQMQQKNEMLQELINQLMDEETRKLYEKLKELMKENAPKDQIAEQLKQLQRNEQNVERDMERALELFKRLKMESALEQNLQKLDTLSRSQDAAAKEEDMENAQNQQDQVNEQFEEFRKKMDEVMQMNQDLKRPEALEDFEYEERQIAKELREIQEMMDEMSQEQESEESKSEENESGEEGSQDKKNQRQQGRQQKQQNAAQKMKNLSQKLSKMQGGMQMEMMQANLDQLRDILDNLIKLSFNQESILKEMKEVNQSDPRFLELSQSQLKLKDDSKVIQDSLLSLASKVVQISSFVTREVDKINSSIDESLDYLKDRNRGRALTSQQFAMTSINNLALLLDDTMQQMQMSMAESMGNSKGEKQQQQGIPDMQELQNQLGKQINELKGSGKSGRELSEELARLAAEQEMIRQRLEMLKEMEEGRPGVGKAGEELQRAIDMMEQNEIDLVNKRLTQQLISRQRAIETRLLEADKAKREQETEEEREAERPSIISKEIPPEFEEYLKLKKKEIELLKTIPVELNPFYKKEVNDYFRRISTEQDE